MDAVRLHSVYTEKFGSLASEVEKCFGSLLRRLFLEIRVTRTIRGLWGVFDSDSPPATSAVNGP